MDVYSKKKVYRLKVPEWGKREAMWTDLEIPPALRGVQLSNNRRFIHPIITPVLLHRIPHDDVHQQRIGSKLADPVCDLLKVNMILLNVPSILCFDSLVHNLSDSR